jgi:hypothetical protein
MFNSETGLWEPFDANKYYNLGGRMSDRKYTMARCGRKPK